MNGHRIKSMPEPSNTDVPPKPDPFYGYDGELSGIDWDCDQDAQEGTEPEKVKRKFKRGDYRLTPFGRVLLVTVIPFFISAILFLFIVSSKDESLPGLIISLNAAGSCIVCIMLFMVREDEGLIQEHPLWLGMFALLLPLPLLVCAYIYITIGAMFEKVEGAQSEPNMKGVPEPQRGPKPPSYKLMPDGHTLYGPEPEIPPLPPRALILPKEKPQGSTGSTKKAVENS